LLTRRLFGCGESLREILLTQRLTRFLVDLRQGRCARIDDVLARQYGFACRRLLERAFQARFDLSPHEADFLLPSIGLRAGVRE
jgi:hypothetical protein